MYLYRQYMLTQGKLTCTCTCMKMYTKWNHENTRVFLRYETLPEYAYRFHSPKKSREKNILVYNNSVESSHYFTLSSTEYIKVVKHAIHLLPWHFKLTFDEGLIVTSFPEHYVCKRQNYIYHKFMTFRRQYIFNRTCQRNMLGAVQRASLTTNCE